MLYHWLVNSLPRFLPYNFTVCTQGKWWENSSFTLDNIRRGFWGNPHFLGTFFIWSYHITSFIIQKFLRHHKQVSQCHLKTTLMTLMLKLNHLDIQRLFHYMTRTSSFNEEITIYHILILNQFALTSWETSWWGISVSRTFKCQRVDSEWRNLAISYCSIW